MQFRENSEWIAINMWKQWNECTEQISPKKLLTANQQNLDFFVVVS